MNSTGDTAFRGRRDAGRVSSSENRAQTRTIPVCTHRTDRGDPGRAAADRFDGSKSDPEVLSGVLERDRTHQRPHLAGAALQNMPQRQRHHDRERQPDAGLHGRQAPDVMALEAETPIEAAVDPLQGGAPVVPPPPGRTRRAASA